MEMKWSTINLTAIEVGEGLTCTHKAPPITLVLGYVASPPAQGVCTRVVPAEQMVQKVEGVHTKCHYTVPVKMPPHVAGQWRWSISNLSY